MQNDNPTNNLVAHTESRPVREHACGNVHGEKLLEEQFGRVGNVNLRNPRLVVAGTAFV